MNNKKFPRVLIIGESFHEVHGGGITLINLFRDWPPDKIAVASFYFDQSCMSYCSTCYQFGYEELKRPWPFCLGQTRKYSGPVLPGDEIKFMSFPTSLAIGKNTIRTGKTMLYRSLRFLGLYPLVYKLNVSERFISWLNEFRPEMIYTQLSSISLIEFTLSLQKRNSLPLAIHIMDDWPRTLGEPGLLHYFWKYKINMGFRKLLDFPGVQMSIGQAMSNDYRARYGKEFIPFQNAIDVEKWKKVARKDWKRNGLFRILYAGRIGRGNVNSILEFAEATELLGKEGFEVQFVIRSGSADADFSNKLSYFKYTRLSKPVRHDEIPGELARADLLFVPLDFEEINFTRLSMPTKIPEYLASGTPILVYASSETALYMYATQMDWGYTVSQPGTGELVKAIRILYADEGLRSRLGRNGILTAINNHEGHTIRERFRETLLKACHCSTIP